MLGATSAFRGVHWDKGKDRWRAEIEVSGRAYKLGRFRDEAQAALAYDRKACELGVPERCNSLQIYTEFMQEKSKTGIRYCAFCRGLGLIGGEYQTVYRGRATIASLGNWRDCPKCDGKGYFNGETAVNRI